MPVLSAIACRLLDRGAADRDPEGPKLLTEEADFGGERRNETEGTRVRAAQYVRASTENQQYSTKNQADAIRRYAAHRGIEIVRMYADEGRSGLSLDGRDALKQLIADVQGGEADFGAILVYDVSRWGRFQDADESAYYEYACKRAGIEVHYCAEQFENDGSPLSTIVKSVKRAMAGEFSRELSAKVFAGQCRLIELGFRQGGPAGYGLRRMLLDQSGAEKGELAVGIRKSIQTDRVILVLGPPEEVETVRWMYGAFVNKGRSESEIAAILNARGVVSDKGRPWNHDTVNHVLTNEKYVGANVWNRMSRKLGKRLVHNSLDMWIRSEEAFAPLVDRALFEAAQVIIRERSREISDEEMLQGLKNLYERYGHISALIIDETEHLACSTAYKWRFSSLLQAYALIGFKPSRDDRYCAINRELRAMHPGVVTHTVAEIERVGGQVMRDEETDLLTVNGEFTVSLVIARAARRPRDTRAGTSASTEVSARTSRLLCAWTG